MLAKKNRLSAPEFKYVFNNGKRLRGVFFVLILDKTYSNKFAVVVSKKKARKATQRNQARRRIWAALRESIDELLLSAKSPTSSFSGIFLLQKSVDELLSSSFDDLKQDINSLLQQANSS